MCSIYMRGVVVRRVSVSRMIRIFYNKYVCVYFCAKARASPFIPFHSLFTLFLAHIAQLSLILFPEAFCFALFTHSFRSYFIFLSSSPSDYYHFQFFFLLLLLLRSSIVFTYLKTSALIVPSSRFSFRASLLQAEIEKKQRLS